MYVRIVKNIDVRADNHQPSLSRRRYGNVSLCSRKHNGF